MKMNSLTSIFQGNRKNDYEFYDYIETARTSNLRAPHDGLQESVFLKGSNVKQRKFSPFHYSINIIGLETIRRIDDHFTQTLNVRIRLQYWISSLEHRSCRMTVC